MAGSQQSHEVHLLNRQQPAVVLSRFELGIYALCVFGPSKKRVARRNPWERPMKPLTIPRGRLSPVSKPLERNVIEGADGVKSLAPYSGVNGGKNGIFLLDQA